MTAEEAQRPRGGRYNVMVVCYGNICRSPTAEVVLQEALKKAGLGDRFKVSSSGVRALVGEGAAPGAAQAAAAQGVSLARHRARQLTSKMAEEADVIVALDEIVEEEILILTRDKVEVVLWAVDDPYGGAPEGYERAFHEIRDHVEGYVAELQSGAGVQD